MFITYILKSNKNGKIYVGFTAKDVHERLREHNNGQSQWTSRNGPFALVYFEEYVCETDARRRELFLKSGIGNRIVRAIVQELNNVNSGRSSDG